MFRHMVKENGNKTKKGVDVRTYQVRWFRIWTLNQLYFKIEPVHSPAGFYKTRTTRRPRQIWCAAGWNALFAYAASLLLIAIVFSYANPWATPRFKLWLLPRLERFLGAFAYNWHCRRGHKVTIKRCCATIFLCSWQWLVTHTHTHTHTHTQNALLCFHRGIIPQTRQSAALYLHCLSCKIYSNLKCIYDCSVHRDRQYWRLIR